MSDISPKFFCLSYLPGSLG